MKDSVLSCSSRHVQIDIKFKKYNLKLQRTVRVYNKKCKTICYKEMLVLLPLMPSAVQGCLLDPCDMIQLCPPHVAVHHEAW